jgi:hypothetical protein
MDEISPCESAPQDDPARHWKFNDLSCRSPIETLRRFTGLIIDLHKMSGQQFDDDLHS